MTLPLRPCVVIPTYNNAAALGHVIDGVLARVPDLIVVNDGSTDETAEVLRRFPAADVVTHEANRGKGRALASGFARAFERGFSHAIALDGDGQHDPTDLDRFLGTIARDPEAIVIGVRRLRGREHRRRKSRLLRAHSNFWVWAETGRWLEDTQSGFRAYPLALVTGLALTSRRYDFEVEVLVKAVWAGARVLEVPVGVTYGPGSSSHFRPVRDFLRVGGLNARLLLERCLVPWTVRRAVHLKSFRGRRGWSRVAGLYRGIAWPSAGRLAASIGVGVCFGILPIWGFQMAAALLVAHPLRLSKPLVLAASNISFPAAIPLILYASLAVGRWVLLGQADWALDRRLLTVSGVWSSAFEYVVGSLVLAGAAGLAVGAVTYGLCRLVRWCRGVRAWNRG